MHVEPAHELPVDPLARLRHQVEVALLRDDRLTGPDRGGMRAGGEDRRAVLGRPRRDLASQPHELRERLVRVRAHRRRDLDDAGEELGLEARAGIGHDLGKERHGLERLRIDEEQLLLHADRSRRGVAEAHLPRMPCTGRPAASQA